MSNTHALKLLALLLCNLTCVGIAHADVSVYPCAGPESACLRVYGQIREADIAMVRSAVSRPSFTRFVALDSPGGEVRVALEIAEFLRASGGYAAFVAGRCNSACVFLLAGANRRTVSGTVGIHRPYASGPTGRSAEEIRRDQEALAMRAKLFFRTVGVPIELFDEMFAVPSSSLKVLTGSELTRFHLNQDDPALTQKDAEDASMQLGVPVGEVNVRTSKLRKCLSEACAAAAYLGITETELVRRRKAAAELCKNDSVCSNRVIVEGR